MEEASEKKSLEEFDAFLDGQFHGTSLSFGGWSTGARALLTAYELACYAEGNGLGPIPSAADGSSLKFALQHALALVHKTYCPDQFSLGQEPIGRAELAEGNRVLQLGSSYNDAVCALVGAFGSYSGSRVVDGRRLEIVTPPPHLAYEVLDALLDGREQQEEQRCGIKRATSTGVGYPPERSLALRGLLSSSGELDLQDDPELLRSLSDFLQVGPATIPDGWRCGLLDGASVRRALIGLKAFALYRTVQIEEAMERYGRRRPPVRSVLRTEPLGALLKSVSSAADVDIEVVKHLVTLLTFGERTRSPDPALQPLFVSHERQSTVIPLNLLSSSRIERNCLSLLARVDRSGFDASSDVFSKAMVSRIQAVVEKRGNWSSRSHVHVPQSRQLGDIDLLVLSAAEKCLLALELKWTLVPADMREIVIRTNTAKAAGEIQLQRLDAVRTNLAELLADCGLPNVSPEGWSIFGAVVFSSFSCAPQSGIHILSESLLVRAIPHAGSLKRLCEWIRGESYVPRMGFEIGTQPIEGRIGEASFQWVEIQTDSPAAIDRLDRALRDLRAA